MIAGWDGDVLVPQVTWAGGRLRAKGSDGSRLPSGLTRAVLYWTGDDGTVLVVDGQVRHARAPEEGS